MVLLQGLSELHFRACFLCISFLMIPRLFSVMFFSWLPMRRPGRETEDDMGVPDKTNGGGEGKRCGVF